MNNTTLVGVVLASIGLVLLYIGLYGWTGAPQLTLTTLQQPAPSTSGGGGFG